MGKYTFNSQAEIDSALADLTARMSDTGLSKKDMIGVSGVITSGPSGGFNKAYQSKSRSYKATRVCAEYKRTGWKITSNESIDHWTNSGGGARINYTPAQADKIKSVALYRATTGEK